MANKLPINLVLSRMSAQPKGSLQVIIDETAHLPKERDFSSTIDTVKKAFKASGIDEQAIASQTRKLTFMSRSLLEDRKDLCPVLREARGVLSEWGEWLEVSDGEATEEELQERLEYLAAAMGRLGEALEGYENAVLKKLRKE
jgi:hypothetical protein